MNGRERLLKTFRGEKADRVPISPFICRNAVYEMFDYASDMDCYWDPPDFDVVEKYVEYCDHFGFDVLHILGSVSDTYNMLDVSDMSVFRAWDNWDVTVVDERKDDAKRRTVTIHTPGGDLGAVENFRKISKYIVVFAIGEHLIKNEKDFDVFRRYAPPADVMDCRMITRAKEATGDKGLVLCCIHGAFNTLNIFRKLDYMMMDPLVDEVFYREMMEYFLGCVIKRVRKMIKYGPEVIEIGGNLATSAVGPDFFSKYVLPYEKRLIDEIHEVGCFTEYHNCGDAARIMHLYNELGTDAWGYVTPPPFGDVDLDEALRVIRPGMVLRGNIDQVDFMVKATPEKIKTRVRDLLLKVKPRGNWILSTSDFWLDGMPYENVSAFAEAGLEYGRY
ncbi:MAG: uroporphyrinogen decarboxylase family protein [Chloroflexota bacterium]